MKEKPVKPKNITQFADFYVKKIKQANTVTLALACC